MNKIIGASLAVVPLMAIGGFVAANSQVQPTETHATEQGYICPVTGEVLPCPKCCVLTATK